MRKGKGLNGLSSKKTFIKNQEDFVFASEMAARFIERRDGQGIYLAKCTPRLYEIIRQALGVQEGSPSGPAGLLRFLAWSQAGCSELALRIGMSNT